MKKHGIVTVVGVSMLVACGGFSGGGMPSAMPTAAPTTDTSIVATAAPAAAPSTSASAPPREMTDDEKIADIKRRVDAAKQTIKEALTLDSSPETLRVIMDVANCRGLAEECEADAVAAEKVSRVGALIGRARRLLDPVLRFGERSWIIQHGPGVDYAQKLADEALVAAQVVADAREKVRLQEIAERDRVQAAQTACDANPGACKGICDKGDLLYCVAMADRARRAYPPKYEEAIRFLTQACDGAVATGCRVKKDVESEWAKYTAKIDAAWAPVLSAADDLAQKKGLAAYASAHFHDARSQLGVKRMYEHIAMLTHDTYCPTVKEFRKAAPASEFATRSKAHCASDAPVIHGDGGKEILLTAECTQVFAIACP